MVVALGTLEPDDVEVIAHRPGPDAAGGVGGDVPQCGREPGDGSPPAAGSITVSRSRLRARQGNDSAAGRDRRDIAEP